MTPGQVRGFWIVRSGRTRDRRQRRPSPLRASARLAPRGSTISGRGTTHPGLERFISEDPIGFRGGDWNLYAYVHNSPVHAVDPLGLYVVEVEGEPDCLVLGGRKGCAARLPLMYADATEKGLEVTMPKITALRVVAQRASTIETGGADAQGRDGLLVPGGRVANESRQGGREADPRPLRQHAAVRP